METGKRVVQALRITVARKSVSASWLHIGPRMSLRSSFHGRPAGAMSLW
jgi:hypothetical protein